MGKSTRKNSSRARSGGPGDENEFDPIAEAFKLIISDETDRSVSGPDVFQDARNIPYVAISSTGKRETHRLDSEQFLTWLQGKFYGVHGQVLASENTLTVRAILVGQARQTEPRTVFCRVGRADDKAFFLDLGDHERRIVGLSAKGFKVVQNAPVYFMRPAGIEPLPRPSRREGTLKDGLNLLFPHFAEVDLLMVAAFLVGALRPTGPYPILQLIGPHGSAKSTVARMIKRLIDPNVADNRSLPRDQRDLAIAAQNSWVLSYDNVSSISSWLSDAFCRLATGGGFATRKLYADADEYLCFCQRPVILNGIGDPIERRDLKDRTLTVHLPPISPDQRETEEQLWARFNVHRGQVLWLLLRCIATAMRDISTLETTELPRLADWYKFVNAAGSVMGFPSGLLKCALKENESTATATVLESSLVAQWLVNQMEGRVRWEATAKEISEEGRMDFATQPFSDPKRWPATPQHFSNELRRLQPDLLRQHGIKLSFNRSGDKRTILIEQEAIGDRMA